MMRKIDLLVLQGTPFCNISCDYCYLPHRDRKENISMGIVEKVIDRLIEGELVSDRMSVVWHAGEPLAVGISFFEKLLDACLPLNNQAKAIQHCVQTNGTLITDRFCDLFNKRSVKIGISLDGPRAIHDKHRQTRSGTGTFDRALRGASLLRDHGIGFDVIAVITRDSLSEPESLYDFFEAIGARSVGFNVDEIEGANGSSAMSGSNYFGQLQQFWERMIRHHFSKRAFHLREIDNLLTGICDGEFGRPSKLTTPFSIVAVDTAGNVGTFSPELLGLRHSAFNDFVIGNVRHHSFSQMIEMEPFKSMQQAINAGTAKCQAKCTYFAVCGGGAPSNKIAENGSFDSTETLYCRATKKIVTNALIEVMRDHRLSNGHKPSRIDPPNALFEPTP